MQKGTTKPGGNRKQRIERGELVPLNCNPHVKPDVHAALTNQAGEQYKSIISYVESQLELVATNGPYEQLISTHQATVNQLRQLAGKYEPVREEELPI